MLYPAISFLYLVGSYYTCDSAYYKHYSKKYSIYSENNRVFLTPRYLIRQINICNVPAYMDHPPELQYNPPVSSSESSGELPVSQDADAQLLHPVPSANGKPAVFRFSVASLIWARVWFAKEQLITKLGWPVAQPRFTRRPSASR